MQPLLSSLLSQNSNGNPVIDHPTPGILQKLQQHVLMLLHRNWLLSSRKIALNSSQDLSDCHEICVCAELYQVVLEFLIAGLQNFEAVLWKAVGKVRYPSVCVELGKLTLG